MIHLWLTTLKEVFLTWHFWTLLAIPVLGFLVTRIVFRSSPLNQAKNAWSRIGRRFASLGWIITGLTFLIYAGTAFIALQNREKSDSKFTESLKEQYRKYYAEQKNYTQRLMDIAKKIEDETIIRDEIDNFATNLPGIEREKFGNAWNATNHGGKLISTSYDTWQGIESILHWPDEKIKEFQRKDKGTLVSPKEIQLRYTPEQIKLYKVHDWAKLYPLLKPEQWIKIKNQILDISDRDDIEGFLRDVADIFQGQGEPTESLNKLFVALENKADLDDNTNIEIYLQNAPDLFEFYKFSLKNRWWFRNLLTAMIFLMAGIMIIARGNRILKESKKELFKDK